MTKARAEDQVLEVPAVEVPVARAPAVVDRVAEASAAKELAMEDRVVEVLGA